jgi:hypothetical protein
MFEIRIGWPGQKRFGLFKQGYEYRHLRERLMFKTNNLEVDLSNARLSGGDLVDLA